MVAGGVKLYLSRMSRNGVLSLGVAGALAILVACHESTSPQPEAPARYITAKRAWLPGERDALIAQIIRDRSFVFPYVGDVSDLAPAFFADPDSVVVIVPNPAYTGSVAGAAFRAPGVAELTMPPAFDSTWIILGQDIRIIDTTQVPADTNDWLGTFWAKKGEETWKGLVLAYRCTNRTGASLASCKTNRTATTSGSITVNTASFDASGAKSGAGGGERRFTTGEYWEGNSGTFLVSAAAYGTASTVTSGPYTGGTQASGSMQGRLNTIVMPRLLPTQDGSSITVDLDFRLTAIGAVRLTCLFSSPCTGQAGSALARRAWGGSFRGQ